MTRLLLIALLALIVSGCSDKKQQYFDDLNEFANSADRMSTVCELVIIDCTSTRETPSFYNSNYHKECDSLMNQIEKSYIGLANCPREFSASTNDIKSIYKDLKKSNDMVTAVFDNSMDWRNAMHIENMDSIRVYRERIENCIYNLKTDIPQAFVEADSIH